MKRQDREILLFKIDVFTPDTLPMARLAEYIAKFAALLGNRNEVHFDKVRAGSAVLQALVDAPARTKVNERLANANTAKAPEDVRKAYRELDDMLRADHAVGTLRREKGGVVLEFPGRRRPLPEAITLWQHGELRGVVVRVGGRGDTIPIWLEDSEGTAYCYTRDRQLAKSIAKHLFGNPLRVVGNGKWERAPDGVWAVSEFSITLFDELSNAPLSEGLAAIRAVRDNEWNAVVDIQAEQKRIRGGAD